MVDLDKLFNAASVLLLKNCCCLFSNNGETFDTNGKSFNLMCFWISVADGVNDVHRRLKITKNISPLKLRNGVSKLGYLVNSDGEEFDLTGKHNEAFKVLAEKLGGKLVVYPLRSDEAGYFIDEDYKVEYQSSKNRGFTIKILNTGSHFEFIAGLGSEGNNGNRLAIKINSKKVKDL